MVARLRGLWPVLLMALCVAASPAAARPLILATTTSVDDSGLLAYLLPKFTAQSGIVVRAVVQGTGAALRLGASGDADVVLVHDQASEEAFVAAGHGVFRKDVMQSRFLIVGPRDGLAGASPPADIASVLRRIAHSKSLFLSRGDESGTHKAELRFWARAGIDPHQQTGDWYRETGSGMGATLNIAAALNAFTLTESATWTSFGNRRDLVTIFDGDLVNPYGVILVNPQRHPHVAAAPARKFIDWLTGPAARRAIDEFSIGGEHPFHSARAAE